MNKWWNGRQRQRQRRHKSILKDQQLLLQLCYAKYSYCIQRTHRPKLWTNYSVMYHLSVVMDHNSHILQHYCMLEPSSTFHVGLGRLECSTLSIRLRSIFFFSVYVVSKHPHCQKYFIKMTATRERNLKSALCARTRTAQQQ